MSAEDLSQVIARLEAVASRLESLYERLSLEEIHEIQAGIFFTPIFQRSRSPSLDLYNEPPHHVKEYDEAVGELISKFLSLSETIEGDAKKLVGKLQLFIPADFNSIRMFHGVSPVPLAGSGQNRTSNDGRSSSRAAVSVGDDFSHPSLPVSTSAFPAEQPPECHF